MGKLIIYCSTYIKNAFNMTLERRSSVNFPPSRTFTANEKIRINTLCFRWNVLEEASKFDIRALSELLEKLKGKVEHFITNPFQFFKKCTV